VFFSWFLDVPENLLLSSEKSSAAVVKLVDFGSARLARKPTYDCGDDDDDDKDDEARPESEQVHATPAYSPPEFLEHGAEGLIDPKFDMWALGVILYIMLTGVVSHGRVNFIQF